jgi:hypothetical protein
VKRLLACLGVAAVVLAGCGSDREAPAAAPTAPPGDYGPSEPGSGPRKRPVEPPRKDPSATVAAALAAGQVGVVGVEGAIGVRPRSLDVAADGALEDITWKAWSPQGAEGSGRLRERDCDPSCASGDIDHVDATVTLSRPRVCGRASYFDRAVVRVSRGRQPQSYVRAPC